MTIVKIDAFVRISYVQSSLKFEAVVHLLNAPFCSLFFQTNDRAISPKKVSLERISFNFTPPVF